MDFIYLLRHHTTSLSSSKYILVLPRSLLAKAEGRREASRWPQSTGGHSLSVSALAPLIAAGGGQTCRAAGSGPPPPLL